LRAGRGLVVEVEQRVDVCQRRCLKRIHAKQQIAAEQQYVAKLKCLCKVGLGSVGVAATPAAEATASPERATERSGWPARTARSMPR
jgi:hypothetical protein